MRFAIFLARDEEEAVVTSYSARASALAKGFRRCNPAVGQEFPRLPRGSTASLPAEKRGKSADRNSPVGNVTRSTSRRRQCAKRGSNERKEPHRPGSAITRVISSDTAANSISAHPHAGDAAALMGTARLAYGRRPRGRMSVICMQSCLRTRSDNGDDEPRISNSARPSTADATRR